MPCLMAGERWSDEFMEKGNAYDLSDGELRVWIEQEAIHIKAIDKFGDPVGLTKEKALELAEVLKRLAGKIVD
jgi:hypothetical protein